MASVVSKALTILCLILCHLSAAQRIFDHCTFKEGKIFSVPVYCCYVSEDIYKEKWHTLFQFPMKIVSDGLEMSEVTRIPGNYNLIALYFGRAGQDDISRDTALRIQFGLARNAICHTETGMRLQDLLSQEIRHLSNCGTDIIFKNTELGNDVEYLNICQCIQPLSINSSKLRELQMPDIICRKADHDDCTGGEHFLCQIDGKCIYKNLLCNGHNDCEDGSDEENCTDRDHCTERGDYRCQTNGKCVDNKSLCDGNNDCEDESDERNCTERDYCIQHKVLDCYENGRCGIRRYKCNEKHNVGYGLEVEVVPGVAIFNKITYTDKGLCSSRDKYRCEEIGKCVSYDFFCDDIDDCRDKSDEKYCNAGNICELRQQARCGDGQCIPHSKLCDNKFDCRDGSDEYNCTEMSVHAPNLKKIITGFKTLMMLNYSEATEKSVETIEIHYKEIFIEFVIVKIKKFHELKHLDFSYSEILSAPLIIVTGILIQSVEILNLTHCEINNLDIIHLNVFPNLKVLDLHDNKIKTIKSGTFLCVSIKYLDLRGNKIYLSGQLFENLKGVNTVDIQDYRLDCADCETLQKPSFQKALRNKIDTRVIYNNMDNIPRCTSPEKYAGEMFDNVNICDENSNWVNIVIAAAVTFLLLILVMSVIGYKYRFEISYSIQYVKLRKRKLASCFCDADGYEYDAFISYCAADRRWVWTVLRPGLEESLEKYHLCLHERDFLLGSKIKDNIDNSMQVSRYCIMILSNYFIESQWCRFELEHAGYKLIEEKREFLIIIELEPLDMTNVPPHLKQLIETRTYLEWDLEKFTEEALVDRLKRALGTSILQKNKQSQEDLDYVDTRL